MESEYKSVVGVQCQDRAIVWQCVVKVAIAQYVERIKDMGIKATAGDMWCVQHVLGLFLRDRRHSVLCTPYDYLPV